MSSLATRAEAIPWLDNLGRVVPLPGQILRPNLGLWKQFIVASRDEEFGITQETSTLLDGFAWLSEDGPNPNRLLSADDRPGADFSVLSALVIRRLRRIPAGPWLVVGPVDLRGAVRAAAVHAFRMAACEAERQTIGFWHRVVDLYERGVWPAGADEQETILVI